MFSKLVTMYKSVALSRVHRIAMISALPILCVAIFVAGAVLVGEHQVLSQKSVKQLASSQRRASKDAPSHSEKEASDNTITAQQEAAETAAHRSENVPPAPAVFSVMKNADVKKKLNAATEPSAEKDAGGDRAELRDGEEDVEARERNERAEKRRLAAGFLKSGGGFSGSQEPEIKGPSKEELAAKGLDGVTFDIQGVTPSEYNGDLRDLPSVPVNFRNEEHEFEKPMNPDKLAAGAKAPTEPYINVPLAPMPSPLQNFAGLSFNSAVTGGQAGAGWPPDVNGDVGLNHYILSVNDAYAIYNKTGTQLAAFTENSLWSGQGVGTPCNANNFGDPVVVYDQFADRWILANFAFATVSNNPVAPYYECFAISKTSDPVAGGWWFYAVRMDTGAIPANTLADYPKFGNWNDGCLYMGANLFGSNGAAFSGTAFASFNKSDMESGAVLRSSIGFINNTTDPFTLIPSNISGATAAGSLPPAGTPNYFVSESQTAFAYEVRKFTPGANCGGGGTLGAATNVSQTSYGLSLGSFVPQPPPATSAHNLDTLDDRIMQKAQYRRVGSVESIWVTHTTRSSGATARPQWAQLNVSGGTVAAAPVQEQIYAPDTTLYRWMAGIAADKQGNVALGYSTSNASSPNFPSVAYSGRLVGDALNQLPQTEVQLIAGTGSQTTTSGGTAIHRWGDYTSMSVDPADDCTFWYAGMYYTNVGVDATRNWNTRIGSFKFPTCTSGGCGTITGTVTGGGTICNGSSSIVSVDVTGGSPPYTVKLTNNAQVQIGSAVQTHFDFTVSPTSTTIYQLDVASSHDNASCAMGNSGSATVTVNQPPTTATVGSNQTICALGTTTGLGGNTPTSGAGTWTVVSGGTGSFGNIHTGNTTFTHATGTGPIVLKWTISNAPCTDSSAQLTITVNQPPTTATVGSNQTICALGTTTGLGGNTPTSGAGTWTVVSGGTGSFGNIHTGNTTFTHATGTGPVVLKWTISNAPCTDSSAQLTITITPQPTATTGGNQSVCVNGTTAGLGGNTPTGGATGMWSVVSGGTGTFSNVNTPNATFTHTGGTGPVLLRWTVSNAPCASATADVSVTINQPPATPTITPLPASVCAGSTGNTASAPVSSSYMWSITNGTITSATNIQVITYTAGGSGNVTLNLTVTNAATCSASNSLMVTIKPIALDVDHESFPGNGGSSAVNVSPTDLTCAWTANTAASYIHITSGSAGVGNGTVQYSVDANPGPNIRSATILIGGQTFMVYQGINFADVPSNDTFYTDIGKLAARGVTIGCGGGNYCPNDPVTREQMSAFIMRAKGEFSPPPPASQRFLDVPPSNPFYEFIDRLAVLGITLGCNPPGNTNYCPGSAVTREQMSAFVLRGLGEFDPPTPVSQRFTDVPPANVFYNFIDRMAVLNITLGCDPGHTMYCPTDPVTRAQMAAFLVRAFDL